MAKFVYEGSGVAAIAEATATVHINTYSERYHTPLIGLLAVAVAIPTVDIFPEKWEPWIILAATWIIVVIMYRLFRQ